MSASIITRLFAQARPYRGLFFTGLAASLLASIFDGVTVVLLAPLFQALFGTPAAAGAETTALESGVTWLLSPLIDGTDSSAAAARLVGILVLALAIKNLMAYAAAQLSVRVQQGLVRDLRVNLFAHLMKVPPARLRAAKSGHLITALVTDTEAVKGVVSAALVSLFQNAALIMVGLGILATISVPLTVVTLLAAPLLVLGMQQLLTRLRRHAREGAAQRALLTSRVSERLSSLKLIKAYGTAASEATQFSSQVETYRREMIKIDRFSSLTGPVSELFGGAILLILIWVAANPAITGAGLTPEVVVVFLVAALKLMSPIKKLAQYPAVMAVALASAERVFELLDLRVAPDDEGVADSGPLILRREIQFDKVSYSYDDGERPALRGVSFAIPRGAVVALVGPSGAGKSTVLDLLARFQDPDSGRILIDGTPTTQLPGSRVRELLGIVSQEVLLLDLSVRDNIAYGVPDATDDEITAAAAAANALNFIQRLPERFGTRLGEGGAGLSGGERQRLALARALLRRPQVLLLDEATSALDAESESAIQQAVERLAGDITVIVVAHRLSSIRHADWIVVLEDGLVVEQGTEADLLQHRGAYFRLAAAAAPASLPAPEGVL